MAVLRMNSQEFAQYHRKLAQKFKPTLLRGIRAGAQRAVAILVDETRTATPMNPAGIGTGGAVNTGAFIRDWKSQPLPDGAVITNRRPYGPIQEWGRRIGAKMPPKQAIIEWIKRRILAPAAKKKPRKPPRLTSADARRKKADEVRLSNQKKRLVDGEQHGPKLPPKYGPVRPSQRVRNLETEAERLSYVIRRAIKRRGLLGRRIMTGDNSMRRVREVVRKEMIHEINRELAKK